MFKVYYGAPNAKKFAPSPKSIIFAMDYKYGRIWGSL